MIPASIQLLDPDGTVFCTLNKSISSQALSQNTTIVGFPVVFQINCRTHAEELTWQKWKAPAVWAWRAVCGNIKQKATLWTVLVAGSFFRDLCASPHFYQWYFHFLTASFAWPLYTDVKSKRYARRLGSLLSQETAIRFAAPEDRRLLCAQYNRFFRTIPRGIIRPALWLYLDRALAGIRSLTDYLLTFLFSSAAESFSLLPVKDHPKDHFFNRRRAAGGDDTLYKIAKYVRDHGEFETAEHLQIITNRILQTFSTLQLKKGDIVRYGFGDFNDGRVIWNGTRALSFKLDIEDYGNIPRDITINQFGHGWHYHDMLGRNSAVVWFDWRGYKLTIYPFGRLYVHIFEPTARRIAALGRQEKNWAIIDRKANFIPATTKPCHATFHAKLPYFLKNLFSCPSDWPTTQICQCLERYSIRPSHLLCFTTVL